MPVLTSAVTKSFELPTVSKKFRLEDFKRGDEKTIHTDYEAAAQIDDAVKQVPDVAETTILGGARRRLRVLLEPAKLEIGRAHV